MFGRGGVEFTLSLSNGSPPAMVSARRGVNPRPCLRQAGYTITGIVSAEGDGEGDLLLGGTEALAVVAGLVMVVEVEGVVPRCGS